jgi:hypothetical protein
LKKITRVTYALHEEVEVQSSGWHQGTIKQRIAKIDSGEIKFLSPPGIKGKVTLPLNRSDYLNPRNNLIQKHLRAMFFLYSQRVIVW